MRSPPWVNPRQPPPLGSEKWKIYSPLIFSYIPGSLRLLRALIFVRAELEFKLFGGDDRHAKYRTKVEGKLLQHLKSTAPEKYHDLLTPHYSVGCKRRVFDSVWLPSLNDPKINLTTQPLSAITEDGIVLGKTEKGPNTKDAEEKTIPTDIIVLANGYEAHHWLHPLKMTGIGGKDLIETMMERGGPQAYQGTALDGFPNFQMIFGPNTVTGHSSVILATENMTDYTMKFVKLVLSGDARTFDVKKEAETAYTQDIQKGLKNSVFQKGGCSSWYFTEDGWNSVALP
jgi:cation diffusion facilitator CzcD-associated flavoprotein CzcO